MLKKNKSGFPNVTHLNPEMQKTDIFFIFVNDKACVLKYFAPFILVMPSTENGSREQALAFPYL